jgi:hypothetical protein
MVLLMTKNINQLAIDFTKLYENRNVKIGILSDSVNKRKQAKPEPSTTNKRGVTRKEDSATNSMVLEELEMKYNILSQPFINKYTKNTTKELDKQLEELTKQELKQNDINKMENGIKSLFVSSILNGKTGRQNSKMTVETKGFDKFGYDTGQLTKNILVEVKNNK